MTADVAGARFRGRSVLVVGAASGIGAEAAVEFGRQGALVFAADIDSAGCARTIERVRAVAAGEGRHEELVLDVTIESHWESALHRASAPTGRLDVLVNSAGVSHAAAVADMDLSSWRRVFAVNVDGALLGLKHAVPLMTPSGGAIVLVTSASGIRAAAGASAYSASKAALAMLMRTVAKECRDANRPVRINAVAPAGVKGPIWSSMAFFQDLVREHGSDDAAYAVLSAGMQHRRFAEPVEVAKAIVYLASDDAEMITGTELVMDGGFVL